MLCLKTLGLGEHWPTLMDCALRTNYFVVGNLRLDRIVKKMGFIDFFKLQSILTKE